MTWKIGLAVLFLVVIILCGLLFYFLYPVVMDINAIPIKFKTTNITVEEQNSSDSLQFDNNMRFAKTNLGYKIEDSCDVEKIERMQEAFEFIENTTKILTFYPGSNDIFVTCKENEDENYLVAGEGGPYYVFTGEFNLIINGTILLTYIKNPCNNFDIELHELLHVFGFDHSTNEKNILYPTISCNQNVDKKTIDRLIELYSIKSLPDLYFTNVSASKHGSYLDFQIEFRNKGLVNSDNIQIKVTSGAENLYETNADFIAPGEGRYLDVKNIKVSRNLKNIEISLVSGEELNLENNNVSLVLEQ